MTAPLETEETPGLADLFANFQLSLDSFGRKVERQTRAVERQLDKLPLQHTIERMVNTANTFAVIDFGTPLAGHRWVVRLLGISRFDATLEATVEGVWYIGPNVPIANGILGATSARWRFGQAPEFQSFTSDSLNVKPGEHLVLGLSVITANVQYGAVAAIDDYLIGERSNG